MNCKNCGAPIPYGYHTCIYCGSSYYLPNETTIYNTEKISFSKRHCRKCGSERYATFSDHDILNLKFKVFVECLDCKSRTPIHSYPETAFINVDNNAQEELKLSAFEDFDAGRLFNGCILYADGNEMAECYNVYSNF